VPNGRFLQFHARLFPQLVVDTPRVPLAVPDRRDFAAAVFARPHDRAGIPAFVFHVSLALARDISSLRGSPMYIAPLMQSARIRRVLDLYLFSFEEVTLELF